MGTYIYHINEIMVEMSHLYAKIKNQYKFKYQLTFSVKFDKYGEDDEIISEIELPMSLSITHNLTQSEIGKINIQWTLENRIQSIEMKESVWNFQRNNTMGISFYKSGDLNGSIYFKILLRSNASVNKKNDDKFCFICPKMASLHPGKNDHPSRVSNYKQYFNELNINGFDFSNGFKCSDMHNFEKINTLSINIFE